MVIKYVVTTVGLPIPHTNMEGMKQTSHTKRKTHYLIMKGTQPMSYFRSLKPNLITLLFTSQTHLNFYKQRGFTPPLYPTHTSQGGAQPLVWEPPLVCAVSCAPNHQSKVWCWPEVHHPQGINEAW